ncbi:hypothetical protein CDAR_562091 [Caerostris darwini]|uniref:Uncharacterized protein n=1 Tax=Caerostris darwini TaxID=1538125 RepID=A0AAV4PDP7_9ARAC|nr:hypothetical protein CDAR_562091 [Caerostris darwini]
MILEYKRVVGVFGKSSERERIRESKLGRKGGVANDLEGPGRAHDPQRLHRQTPLKRVVGGRVPALRQRFAKSPTYHLLHLPVR